MKTLIRLVLAIAACVVVASVLAATASAFDAHPCSKPVAHEFRGSILPRVQYCPLWRGHVPVYAAPTSHSRRVGWLRHGGSVNWFLDQLCTAYWYNPILRVTDYPLRLGRYVNGWWASTFSDPPIRLGYVNEVYFRGGGNWEADGGLFRAGPGSNHPSRHCHW